MVIFRKIILSTIVTILFGSCCTFLATNRVIYKPKPSIQGYSIKIPQDYDNFIIISSFENNDYEYVFNNSKDKWNLYISNTDGESNWGNLIDGTFLREIMITENLKNPKDTIVCSGKTRCVYDGRKVVDKKPYFLYWKAYFIFFGTNENRCEINYGYLNVRRRYKRFFDEILESVKPLKDTIVTTDSVLIKLKNPNVRCTPMIEM